MLGDGVIADLDLAVAGDDTAAAARAIAKAAGRHAFPLSEDFGAWRVAGDDWICDVTELQGDRIEDDLRARDFTINAMALPLFGGALVDPHGGQADLSARTLRMVAPDAYARDRLRPLRLVRFVHALVGHLRGGLLHVMVLSMYLVSGLSGSKTADVAAVGSVMRDMLKKEGYGAGEGAAVLAASAAMGETVPPSIAMLVLGSITTLSMAALFVGGLIPAAVVAACLMALIWLRSPAITSRSRRFGSIKPISRSCQSSWGSSQQNRGSSCQLTKANSGWSSC